MTQNRVCVAYKGERLVFTWVEMDGEVITIITYLAKPPQKTRK